MLSRPDYTGGTSTAQAGVGVEAPLDDVTLATGHGLSNTAWRWRELIANQDVDCGAVSELDGDVTTAT